MASSQDLLTTQEFAKKAGVSTSTASKWLRSDKIKGKKKSGKWMIPAAELSKVSSTPPAKPAKTAKRKTSAAARATKPEAASKSRSYSVKEFSEMTYLTEFGVTKWLQEGRLIRSADQSGEPMVDAANLEVPDIKRLLR